ncbi:transcription termination factor NusA [Heliorestis convoluta]|uniref:Transcription termination/antitermination protein NusA n=1 Tax=Heliorestis convoluta TaxID=356322 RepID=A0A5Q2MZV9_9FIRM|nr:transcription termination factor NusA [Heliorestis convoluta]QGG48217.1 transcription termination factor NusA [Heliorestis convoluta]
MNVEFLEALQDLEREKNISKEILIEAIEAALISAYKKNFGSLQNVRVHIDRASGEFKVYSRKNVVDNVVDSRLEISLEEAKTIDPRYQIDDIIEFEVTPRNFGRIAAQTAKQVVVQRIREAERGMIYEEFSNREGDIVSGIVQRMENKNIFVDLGRVEALLAPSEQMTGESYRHGDRIKAYIVEVKKTTKGPQVMISRTHPGLLKRLFELEVPEIHDGTVELKAASREAGARSKIAVYSRDENVDPVGACVGPKGMRVQAIVTELRGEKIDIVKWNEDPARFVANALSPAKVISVDIIEDEKVARVIVPDYQLSLAIGKEGQNARLAAKLTGWKIDIKSESQAKSLQILPSTYDEQGNYENYELDYEYPEDTVEEVENYDASYDEDYDYDADYEEVNSEYDENYDESYEKTNENDADYEAEDDQKS